MTMSDTFLFREVLAEVDPALQFLSASDGEEALQKLTALDASLPYLIFMDLNMPRMDGKECLAALKKNES
jgi:CheY-like chemotaxis protein